MKFITPKSPVKIFIFLAILVFGNFNTANAQQRKLVLVKKLQTTNKDVRRKVPEKLVAKNAESKKILPKITTKIADEDEDETSKSTKSNSADNTFRTETVRNIAQDNFDGEDLQIRRAAVNALGNRAGTVVVMEVKTGKILTIVNQNWGIRQSFKPCSTIKLVTGIAGSNENLIDETGRVRNRTTRFNLNDSLAFSENGYFQQIGKSLGSKKMIEYAKQLGLGQKTGINANDESEGRLPYGNENLRIYSHGDDFEVTPLQLAVLVSAIHNDGKIVVPRVPRTKIEKTNFRGFLRREVDLPKESIESVITGMRGAAKYGTARRGTHPDFNIAGKTGSCIEHNSWVGLFASVAPLEDPKYSVVVITRGQGERGKYAAMVAGQIYEALRPRLFTNDAPVLLAKYNENKNNKIIVGETEKSATFTKTNDVRKLENSITQISSTNPNNSEGEKNIVTETQESEFSTVVIEYKKETEENQPADSNPAITRPRIVKIN